MALLSGNVRLALAIFVAGLFFVVSIAGSYALALHAVSSSQHNWCAALDVLTAKPVPEPADPAANPSRVATYQFYESLKRLETQFGCRP